MGHARRQPLIFQPLKFTDIDLIEAQPSQANERESLAANAGEWIERYAWTAWHGEQPLAAGGLVPMWSGRALAWTFVGKHAGPHLLALTREAARILSGHMPAPFTRIEATVDVNFEPGIRWAYMMGMVAEGRMRKFSPDGRDMYLFARVV